MLETNPGKIQQNKDFGVCFPEVWRDLLKWHLHHQLVPIRFAELRCFSLVWFVPPDMNALSIEDFKLKSAFSY